MSRCVTEHFILPVFNKRGTRDKWRWERFSVGKQIGEQQHAYPVQHWNGFWAVRAIAACTWIICVVVHREFGVAQQINTRIDLVAQWLIKRSCFQWHGVSIHLMDSKFNIRRTLRMKLYRSETCEESNKLRCWNVIGDQPPHLGSCSLHSTVHCGIEFWCNLPETIPRYLTRRKIEIPGPSTEIIRESWWGSCCAHQRYWQNKGSRRTIWFRADIRGHRGRLIQ